MPVLVVDASAIAALVHDEPGADEIVERVSDATLVAPRLLPHELDSVCLRKIRAAPRERSRLLAARALADQLQIALLDVDHPGVIELALATGLTAYDASYLWLAGTHGAELVTLDARLERAAARLRR